MHVQQIPHHRDRFYPLEKYDDKDFRLRFRLRKDSVIDLLKVLNEDLSTRRLVCRLHRCRLNFHIALRFYTTGVNFLAGYRRFIWCSVFAAFTTFHGAIAKQKKNIPCHSLRT